MNGPSASPPKRPWLAAAEVGPVDSAFVGKCLLDRRAQPTHDLRHASSLLSVVTYASPTAQ
jgi:hypothetical protein